MIFTSPIFILFFSVLMIIYWSIKCFKSSEYLHNCKMPMHEHKNDSPNVVILLIFGLLFYAAWDPRFLLLLGWVSLFDYGIGRRMEREISEKARRILLYLSLFSNLSILGTFKYLGFFQDTLLAFLEVLHLDAHFTVLRVILPVGISFYIFQSISYVVDVFKRVIPAERNYAHYLLFLTFFPQLVAGPIVKAKEFLPQIRNPLSFSQVPWKFAIFLILLGAFKKAVLADHLAVTSDFSFGNPSLVNREFLWLGLLSYAGQIYCDFSGYTDIAQGAALMLGFRLPENFRMPYLSKGFSDFWKRWHISLSDWLRNYLYFPLGGNRNGKLQTYRNLLLVMLIGGLWHGANWTFVFWGFGHGMLLLLEKLMFESDGMNYWERSKHSPSVKFILDLTYRLFTFINVLFLWIFFRSSNFEESLCYLQGLFSKNGDISIPYAQLQVTGYCFVALILGHVFGQRYFQTNEQLMNSFESVKDSPFKVIAFGALFSLCFIVVVLLSGDTKPFVYFVF